jgi:pimeloyl-ACP methyl ester carboxylesterase
VTAVRRGYADTSLGQVHYYDAGARAGAPTLLLLHQSPQSGGMFEAVFPLLAPHVRAIAMDTIGYGMSDRPARELDPEDYARSMADLMDSLGVARFAIAGVHSGAALGIQAAIQYADRVASLVLSGPPLRPPLPPDAPRRRPALRPPPEPQPDGSHLAQLWQQRWAVAAPVDPHVFQRRLLNALIAGEHAVSAYGAVYRYDLTERLKRVRCPVLIVYGDRDVETPNIIECLPLVPQIPTHVIPGGNIYTVDVRPREWADAVLQHVLRGG